MAPPDLPPRPVPRAPLSDVVPRRTLVIIAVIVVLAVIGTVLALTVGGDDGTDTADGGGGKVTADASAGADTKKDDKDGTENESANSGSGASDTPSGEAGGSDDSGTRADDSSGSDEDSAVDSTHQGSQGYSIGLPEGWKYRSTDAAGDRYTGPEGQKLLVGWTSTPKSDPVADWENQERSMSRSQYKRIRIEKVDYRGWNTADWEFTYEESGTKYRTIDRGFVVDDDLGYALMYTAKATDWGSALRETTWRTLADSFQPRS